MDIAGLVILGIVSVMFYVSVIIWCYYGLQHQQQRGRGQVINGNWFVGFGRSERSLRSLENPNILEPNNFPQISIQIQHDPQTRKIIESLPLFVLRQLPDGSVCALAEEECPICQEPFLAGEILTYLPCGHVFHYTSVVPWLTKNNHCPLCRQEVLFVNKIENDQHFVVGITTAFNNNSSYLNCSGPFCYLPNPATPTNTFPHISSVQSIQSVTNR